MRKDLEIDEIREEIYFRDRDRNDGDVYKCMYRRGLSDQCEIKGYYKLQMAHRASLSKKNIKHVMKFWYDNYDEILTFREAEKILNNKLNLITSCPAHNQSFLIDNNPVAMNKLLIQIKQGANFEDVMDETLFSGNFPI